MAQKPVLRGEVRCVCVAREVSVEREGMGERGHPAIAFRKSSSGSPVDQLMRVFGGSSALTAAAIAKKSGSSKELPALALAAAVASCTATGTGLAAALGGERRVAAATTGVGAGGRPASELFFSARPAWP